MLAARRAGEVRLDVRQPEKVGPTIRTDRGRVAAPVVAAVDQHATNTHVALVALLSVAARGS
jgi:hypothetical protein